MKPYTAEDQLHDTEQDLREALDRGAPCEELERYVAQLDALEQHEPVSLHQAARAYAEQGLHVFPLARGSKIPLKGSGGCKDATDDPDMVDAWWEGNPRANIGIATGHLVDVIDIDGPAGVIQWAHLLEDLPPTLGRVSTPRPGGVHLYVEATGRGNRAGIFDHIDYRGDGGYVVAPPSVITSGDNPGDYVWYQPLELA